jgi:hypothetical protein
VAARATARHPFRAPRSDCEVLVAQARRRERHGHPQVRGIKRAPARAGSRRSRFIAQSAPSARPRGPPPPRAGATGSARTADPILSMKPGGTRALHGRHPGPEPRITPPSGIATASSLPRFDRPDAGAHSFNRASRHPNIYIVDDRHLRRRDGRTLRQTVRPWQLWCETHHGGKEGLEIFRRPTVPATCLPSASSAFSA